jgi:hypothetical protein
MDDIFTALRHDHDRQRDLIARLVATSGDEVERRRCFEQLAVELRAHAAMEERYLYRPMMAHDLTQEKARHSVAEHKALDDLVEQLETTDRSSPAWLAAARTLEHDLVHHLDEEEHEVFQLAGRALDDARKVELAGAYTAGMAERRDEAGTTAGA